MQNKATLTIQDHLAKQREFRSRHYAQRLVSNKAMMADFKLRARLYGTEWKLKIWALAKEINQERKK